MKTRAALVICILLLASGCTPGEQSAAQEPAEATSTLPPGGSAHPCGDGICRGPENPQNCPADCPPREPPAADSDETQVYWIANPTSGSLLYVRVFLPETGDGSPAPTLVLIPGGIGDSSAFTAGRKDAQELVDGGFVVVVFDPDGRGQSEGEEDKNGHIHQDGLAEIIETIAGLPFVDADRIGLISYSYGITMAAGALARYPDLPVRFLIDWEGPANREDTTHGCGPGVQGAGSIDFMSDCGDEAFWSEREAQTFIAHVQQYYQRLQTEQDHSQPDSSNAIDMINAAVGGGVPWVRLNDLPPNQVFDEASLPPMLPESVDRDLASTMARYAAEILALLP